MRNATHVIYRRITPSDFFNIYKAPGTEDRGGGQAYIDIDTSGVSIANWRTFFSGVQPVNKKGGPAWDFKINSLQILTSQDLKIAQRRATSVSIRSQKLLSRASNRVLAWHPARTGFPSPPSPPTSARDASIPPLIKGLVIFLIKDDQGEYWAGWFQSTRPASSWKIDPRLDEMFSNGEGSVELNPAIPFDETILDWPFHGTAAARHTSQSPAAAMPAATGSQTALAAGKPSSSPNPSTKPDMLKKIYRPITEEEAAEQLFMDVT